MINDNDKKFYLKMSAILIIAAFIWFSGSSKEKEFLSQNPEKMPLKNKPAALENFIPLALVIFDDSKDVLPRRNWRIPPLELQAPASLAMKLDGSRIYYNKNMGERRPVASLTKLMTAIVVLENFDLDGVIKISADDVKRDSSRGNLAPNELLTARSLLNIMLIDSSNDAAAALARQRPDFILKMNQKTKELGLNDTNFTNPDGLDEENNYSSAFDIAKIFGYLVSNHLQAGEILKTKNLVVYSSDGKIEHRVQNTNTLLSVLVEIKAGKTGYTDKAGGTLALLISGLEFGDENDIIAVVLGSPDRFSESEKLINWLREAYIWSPTLSESAF